MLELLLTFICILLSIAFFTIAERKVLASIQRRKGPNVTGFWGTLQAIADDLKLIFKEVVISVRANWILFFAAPSVTLLIGLLIWVFIPFSDVNYLTNGANSTNKTWYYQIKIC
jgi:NADH:ubiquinone oxidoreductase subunit H